MYFRKFAKKSCFVICLLFLFLSAKFENAFASFQPLATEIQKPTQQDNLQKKESSTNELSTISDEKTNELISILENQEKRQAFLENLKHLKYMNDHINDGEEKDESIDQKNKTTKNTKEDKKTDGLDETIINQINDKIIEYIEASAEELIKGIHILANFPKNVWSGFQHFEQTETQQKTIDFVIVLILSLATGFITEVVLRILLFGIRRPSPIIPSWRYFTTAAFLSFIPLSLFAGVSYVMVEALQKPIVASHINVIIGTFFITRTLATFFKLFFQPFQIVQRLTPLGERNAKRLYRQVTMFNQVLVLGVIILEIFQIIGVNHLSCNTWKSIIGFCLFLILSALIIDYRRPVARLFRYDNAGSTGMFRLFINFTRIVSRLWYVVAILVLLTIYLSWVYGNIQKVLFLSQGLSSTIALVFVWRFLHGKLAQIGKKWSTNWQDLSSAAVPQFDAKNAWNYAKTVPVVQSAHFLIPLCQFFLFIGTVVLSFQVWGANFLQLLSTPTSKEYITTGLSIILIMAAVRVLWAFIDIVAKSQLQPSEILGVNTEPTLFVKTVMPIIRSTFQGIVGFIGFLLILAELSIPTSPILYSFTVIGLAISFGAQTMVKDIITGFLTLFEGNIKVGEYVVIGSHAGVVEAITLRSVFLRHSNGAIQSIPFSEVNHVVNRSRDYTLQIIDVAASHTTSLKQIYNVLMETIQEIKEHAVFGPMIIGPLKVSGISQFTDTAIHVAASIKTLPDPKGDFLKEFNAHLQQKLLQANILPPLQHQINYSLTDIPRFGGRV